MFIVLGVYEFGQSMINSFHFDQKQFTDFVGVFFFVTKTERRRKLILDESFYSKLSPFAKKKNCLFDNFGVMSNGSIVSSRKLANLEGPGRLVQIFFPLQK